MARQATTPRKRAPDKSVPAPRAARKAVVRSPQLDGLGFDKLGPDQKIAHLLSDREALVARIIALEAEVAALKATQTEVADRIAWTLDSLRDLLGGNG